MAKFMEEDLDAPLSQILPMIGDGILHHTKYFGVKAFKSPIDAWVYQEIIYETKPDVIVEIGNFSGGSTLYLAHLCDLIGKGRIIGIDISHENVHDHIRKHPRITLIEGDACQEFNNILGLISNDERVLVIEDSSHTYENTLNVLRVYSELVKPGDYFIVEDSIIHHGFNQGPIPGPYEAIEKFIDENKDFEIDRTKEHFFITWNPKGYLKRKSNSTNRQQLSYQKKPLIGLNGFKLIKYLKLFIPPILIIIIKKLNTLIV